MAVLGWPVADHDAVRALWATLPLGPAAWLSALQASPTVGNAATPGCHTPLVLGGSAEAPLLYLRRYFGYESGVATQVAARAAQPFAVDAALARHWLDKLFDAPTPSAAAGASPPGPDWQKLACALALRAGLTVITGGPGTGKTHTAARLLALLFAFAPEPDRLRVALAAPTGKAAARLRQSIEGSLNDLGARLGSTDNGGLDLARLTRRMGPARTLHGLLGARPGTRQLRHHAGNPHHVLLVDEASMVHLEMVAALMAALPPQARVAGRQRPTRVGQAGAVLGDLCQHAALGDYSQATRAYAQAVAGVDVPPAFWADPATPPAPLAQQTAMLRESRRFGGPIGQLASAVNAGDAAAAEHLLAHAPAGGPLRRLASATPDALLAACVNTQPDARQPRRVFDGQRPPQALAEPAAHAAWVVGVLTAFERFRVLCAVHEGPWGTQALNTAITQALAAAGLLQPTGAWYAGRPVMVTRNDPGLGVFNGDVGVALPAPVGGWRGRRAARVWFLDGDAPALGERGPAGRGWKPPLP
jgi:exodeoxyribonuclease V alpha subunit